MKPLLEPKVPRINMRRIAGQILKHLNLEKGLGYTFKKLAVAPKGAIQEYLYEDRTKLIKPVTLLVLMVTLATFMTVEFFMSNERINSLNLPESDFLNQIPNQFRESFLWFTQNEHKYFNLLLLGNLPSIALGTFLVFNKERLNFAEHLVINIYIISFTLLLYIILMPTLLIHPGLSVIHSLITSSYVLYAYLQIFDSKFWPGLGKFFVVYLIQQISYILLLLLTFLIATVLFF